MGRVSRKRKVKRFFKTKGYMSKKTIISLIVVLVLLVFFGVYELILLPKIDLKGNDEVRINYKSKYVEKGFKATYLGKNITEDVKEVGKVNSNKLGTYEITYKVGSGLFKRTVVRKVIVEDLEKPKLSIKKGNMYVCPGDKVKAEKVTVTDNYDGDLTKKLKVKVRDDKVVYKVIDSSGNTTELTKKVYYKDVSKPDITLKGDETMYMFVGDNFEDPGAEAKDNCDGDISKNIKVDNNIDNTKEGDYEVSYKVKDKAGNEGVIVRKIKMSEKKKGVVYLTFDDGPNEGTTNVILDILKEKGVKATFFVTNKGPDELIKREFDEGHTVALHTASHDYSIVYASDESYFNDLNSVGDRVKRITGQESKIVRFPGGSSNTVSRRYSQGIMSRLTTSLLEKGYKYYDWNISSGDAGETTDPNQIVANVTGNLSRERANIVLMHDIKTYTRDALARIIDYCKNNGYPMDKITMSTEMVTQRVNN